MPLDAVMHLYTTLQERRRLIRFLIIPSLLQLPFLSNFLTKLGGVIANQENAALLLAEENLVGIFPEESAAFFRATPRPTACAIFQRAASPRSPSKTRLRSSPSP
jgi:hypothetical protein